MNPFDRMHTFVRVAELASFTQAAEVLGIPKASASTAVQQLETQLGTRLLHRTTRRVQLTQDGQAYYERCKDLLADVDELQSMFQNADGGGLRGRVRIDMSTGMARNVVVPRLPELLARHPGLEVELSSTERRVDVVREGFDCVLRTGAVVDASLVARPLGPARLVNCASPAYLRVHGTPQTLDDLGDHRLVHFVNTLGARSGGFEAVVDGTLAAIPMQGALTVNNAEAYIAGCLAGLGIIQVPRLGVVDLLAQGALVEVLPQHAAPPMPLTLMYANRRNLPRRVRAVMDWLAEVVGEHLKQDATAAHQSTAPR
ncbi:transcriptional regulator, LysR family [Paracidovorax avenae ATCC 19860]|uniref:Transcriptional regulator, LysR family n=1 Tax=Paracidovorax avenae (strain ATCC 19860 / DSM 7227 / CCUG 15838 / JCM 20985 / LMG 2117 / NCPPB 1011) TaxID=643561 RepID=F0Q2U3_PARA1|nr:LysR family transcriptional regulator [Paracidovorax avenae]ADX44202.1 transcriptional regulator, LysR family [Paracidovorax avenae ATCC 19860]AVS65102.1 LysR family transcriptional regulator [Paracidovorax avenae]